MNCLETSRAEIPGRDVDRDESPNCRGSYPDPRRSKIHPKHLERLAIVYVRQSTAKQVLDHRESRELQYNLRYRAEQLGWPAQRVVIIDEDQGQSGATAENRLGFQRLMAEVSLSHVGIVLGWELSRLARSNKDWRQLLELCAIFDALLADQDALYDPADYNDRLLLGLTGIMSEAELHILRNRMMQGKRNKAERGELFSHVPRGFVRAPGGEVALDPDEQVQSVMRLFFARFEALRSGRRLYRWLLDNQILLPVRPTSGPHRGELQRRKPSPTIVYQILHHPIYAGAYSYGRHPTDPRRKIPGRLGSGRMTVPPEQWQVLKKDQLPAYIGWEQYLANLQCLAANASRFEAPGAAREGEALLSGLITCEQCGYQMHVVYNDHLHQGRYVCQSRDPRLGTCQGIQAQVLDRLVTKLALRALEPAALEMSMAASRDLEQQRRRLHEHWQQRVTRATYEAQRARRQYDAVEPENRLVARELEKCWEEKLREQRALEEDYARFQREQPRELSSKERDCIRELSSNIASVWNAPTTTAADRKTILRHLVDALAVRVLNRSEAVEVTIHWVGGFESRHATERPVGCYEQLRDYDRLRSRVLELRATGQAAGNIAEQLNAEGFRTARGKDFQAETVRALLSRRHLTGSVPQFAAEQGNVAKPDQWSIHQMVLKLGVPLSTLCRWCRQGWVHGVKPSRGPWKIWADAEELARLCRLRDYRRADPSQPYPAELTTPGPVDHT